MDLVDVERMVQVRGSDLDRAYVRAALVEMYELTRGWPTRRSMGRSLKPSVSYYQRRRVPVRDEKSGHWPTISMTLAKKLVATTNVVVSVASLGLLVWSVGSLARCALDA